MTTKRVFVIRNQLGQYLDKHSGWQSGKDANALFRVDFHDQALNTLLEINSKDITLRGKILEVDLDDKKRPVVEVSEAALALDKHLEPLQEELVEIVQDDGDDEEEASLADSDESVAPMVADDE